MTAWLQNVYETAKSSAAATAGGERSGQLGGDQHEQAAGDRRLDGRRRFSACAGSPPVSHSDSVADREVERVAVARRDHRRADHGLKRSGVAEVEAGQQRRVIQREGRRGDDQRGERAAADHAPAALSARRAWRR